MLIDLLYPLVTAVLRAPREDGWLATVAGYEKRYSFCRCLAEMMSARRCLARVMLGSGFGLVYDVTMRPVLILGD